MGYWIRLNTDVGDDPADRQCGRLHVRCRAVTGGPPAHPDAAGDIGDRKLFQGASLDHSVWFQRPTDPSMWHWFDTRSHGLSGGRGLVTGDVVRIDGLHAATIAQEVPCAGLRPLVDGAVIHGVRTAV